MTSNFYVADPASLDDQASLLEHGIIDLRGSGERGLIRLASFARAETGTLGIGRREVEGHVLRPGATCGAGRPAVHAGGPDGVEEFPVLLSVARRH